MDTAGKVALVTGGGSGIGRATALALASAGAAVVVVDIDRAGGEETVSQVEANGHSAVFVEADVSRRHGIESMFRAAEDTYGGIDILHNNAALVSGGAPSWPETSLDRITHVIATNLTAVVMGTRVAADMMRKRGGGVVVNTGSGAALGPLPYDPLYVASKAGVMLFTQSCTLLQQSHNVRVAGVLVTGFYATPVWNKFGDGVQPPTWLKPVLDQAPLLPPEDVAAAVLDVVRDDSLVGEMRMVPAPA